MKPWPRKVLGEMGHAGRQSAPLFCIAALVMPTKIAKHLEVTPNTRLFMIRIIVSSRGE